MSKEFEELVLMKLEKLDVLEEKVSNADRIMQEVVLKKLDTLEEKTDNTDKVMQEVVLKKLEKLDVLDKRTLNLEEKYIDTDETLKEISTELQNLNNKFTVFDYEINRKIDSLFDAFVVNTEKDTVHEEKIESMGEKILNHDIRISNLEGKVLIA